MAIDPGQRMGLAYWETPKYRKSGPLVSGNKMPTPTYLTTLRARDDQDDGSFSWDSMARCQVRQFETFLQRYRPDETICELPAFFVGSATGHAAAARQDVVKLVYLVGGLSAVAMQRGLDFWLVEVNRWKGQMSKEAVKKRLIRRNPDLLNMPEFKGDAVDAVGIGAFKMGWFG